MTGAAGTSIACIADRFTYKACAVPKPKGKSLKAGCKLGGIGGEKSKSAKVKQQSPKPGKALAPGSKVNVKLDS